MLQRLVEYSALHLQPSPKVSALHLYSTLSNNSRDTHSTHTIMYTNYYQFLEVSPTASSREICTVTQQLTDFQLDTSEPDDRLLQLCDEARRIFSDEARRKAYDAKLARERAAENGNRTAQEFQNLQRAKLQGVEHRKR